MQVTRANFDEVFPSVKAALGDCSFCAIDCEFTGLNLPWVQNDMLDDPSDRYGKVCQSAKNFLITQWGLSTFHSDESTGGFTSRTFNFYTFPKPYGSWDKRFTCQSSCITFLAEQGFDFNRCFREGVPFVPRDKMKKLEDDAFNPRERGPITVQGERDEQFVRDLVDQVSTWLAGDLPHLTLAPCNSFLRAVTHQELQKDQFGADEEEGPGFYVNKITSADGQTTLQLIRCGPAGQKAFAAAALQRKKHELAGAEGMSRVISAITAAGKPVVGHNCLLDLVYSLDHFVGELPSDYDNFKALVAAVFPGGLYDTKHLCRGLDEVFAGETTLGEAYEAVAKGTKAAAVKAALAAKGFSGGLPECAHADGFDIYEGEEASQHAHEAGYDAYMTGVLFAGCLRLLEARPDGRVPPSPEAAASKAGRLNMMRSELEYFAAHGPNAPMERDHVFRVDDVGFGVQPSALKAMAAAAGLGEVQINWDNSQRGKKAIFITTLEKELAEREGVKERLSVEVAKECPAAVVSTYTKWHADKVQAAAARKEAGATRSPRGGGGRGMGSPGAGPSGTKRPRSTEIEEIGGGGGDKKKQKKQGRWGWLGAAMKAAAKRLVG